MKSKSSIANELYDALALVSDPIRGENYSRAHSAINRIMGELVTLEEFTTSEEVLEILVRRFNEQAIK